MKKKRSRVVSGCAWVASVLCCGLCCSWVVGGGLYWVDIASGFLWAIVLASGVVGVGLCLVRRWGAVLVCVVGMGMGVYPIFAGRSLVVGDALIGEVVVRMGSWNIYPKNENWRQDLETLMDFGLDVIVIQEISPDMNRTIGRRGYLDGSEMPYWVKRDFVDGEVSPCLIISRYPLELIEVEAGDEMGAHQLMCVVEYPGKRFVAGLVHPFSPRTVDRWEAGNAAVVAHGRQIRRVAQETGLGVIVGADLNAGYGQVRGRELRKAGMRASKPILPVRWGSFPAGRSPLVRVQLDDLWVSDGVGVSSWETINIGVSDHRLVIAELVIRDGHL